MVEDTIKSIFPTAEIKRDNYYDRTNVNILCNDPDFLAYSNYGDNIDFKIYNNKIQISYIIKCDNLSASEFLDKIKVLALLLNIHTLELIDGSFIEYDGCWLPFDYLYILKYGESWYNTKGFKSKNYNNEVINNKELINLSFKDFILKVAKKQKSIKLIELNRNIENFKKRNVNFNNAKVLKHEKNALNILHREYITVLTIIIDLFEKLQQKYDINANDSINTIVKIIANKNNVISCISTEMDFLTILIQLSKGVIIYNVKLMCEV